ncbi:MAG: SCO1664 family protein [Anaerolineae bacterium]|nr:SCO1664 family protein [Anaerolineae bacterium]MBL6966588.1 SCO1664 family protein [Anaerolineales bacterium]
MHKHILTALNTGTFSLEGEFVHGANYSFLVQIQHQGEITRAVYKPEQGERPLWDFPDNTLAHREAAAYIISQSLGWELVPPTVYRNDGPYGPGSLQNFIPHDPNYHYFNLSEAHFQCMPPVILFDLLVNNADRKGSHLLFDADDHLWLIDHGLCFHVEDKLRTVIWDYAGEAVPPALLADLQTLNGNLAPGSELVAALAAHLAPEEIAALSARAESLQTLENFPHPPNDRRAYPYPPL